MYRIIWQYIYCQYCCIIWQYDYIFMYIYIYIYIYMQYFIFMVIICMTIYIHCHIYMYMQSLCCYIIYIICKCILLFISLIRHTQTCSGCRGRSLHTGRNSWKLKDMFSVLARTWSAALIPPSRNTAPSIASNALARAWSNCLE